MRLDCARTLRLVVVIVDQNVGARHINENRCDVAFWHETVMPVLSPQVRYEEVNGPSPVAVRGPSLTQTELAGAWFIDETFYLILRIWR
jgi:hypothetical protein